MKGYNKSNEEANLNGKKDSNDWSNNIINTN